MSFEVYHKCGHGWRYLGIVSGQSHAAIVLPLGPGVYKVRPEDSRDKFIKWRVRK